MGSPTAAESPGVIAFFLYKLGSLVARLLPLKLTYLAAAAIADLNFLVNFRSRGAVISNLRHVRGARARPGGLVGVTRRVFRNFAYNIVDFLCLPALDRAALSRVISVEGLAHLETERARGRGVILVSGHIGNWEWGGAYFALSGIEVKTVALPHGAGRVTRFFDEQRQAKGLCVLPFTGSTFAMVEWLHAGGVVGLIADRDYAEQGIPVPFFGTTTVMPRAHASLALKTGAALLPCFCLRRPGGRFRLEIRPPVAAGDLHDLPPDERIVALVTRCLAELEEAIAAHPDQWMVFAPMWPQSRTGSGDRSEERGRSPTRAPAESRS